MLIHTSVGLHTYLKVCVGERLAQDVHHSELVDLLQGKSTATVYVCIPCWYNSYIYIVTGNVCRLLTAGRYVNAYAAL